jgi:hypothetical protein
VHESGKKRRLSALSLPLKKLTSQHCFTGFLVSFQAASTATMAQLLADTAAAVAVLVVVVLAVVLVALVVKLCQWRPGRDGDGGCLGGAAA